MEKIKKILSPGKESTDEILYGSGRGGNPVVERASRTPGGLHSSATSPPKPIQNDEQGETSQLDLKDHANATQRPSNVKEDTLTSTTTGHSETSKADADANLLATREADKLSTGKTDRSSTNEGASLLRPEYPAPASAGSNASIKSNVVGKVPTGSSFTQEKGTLPQIPASGGKFMEEPLSRQQQGSSSTSAFPLAASSSSTDPTVGGTRQTELGKRLDSSHEESPSNPSAHSAAVDTADSRDHHGRDALLGAGTAGAVGTGAYALSQSKDRAGQDPSTLPGSTETTTTTPLHASASTTTTTVPLAQSSATAAAARPAQTRGLTDEIRSRHMPGAWPQTPANEIEKTLGSDATGVGSGAAVIAAQKAYGKHTPDRASDVKPSATHRTEPTPYASSLDARVNNDATSKAGHNHQATSAALTGGALATGAALSSKNESTPQGTFGEKIQDVPTTTPGSSLPSTGAILTGGTAASGAGLASREEASPQGTLGEKIQEAQKHEVTGHSKPAYAAANTPSRSTVTSKPQEETPESKDQDSNKNYAAAGAAGAAVIGAGAYGYSKYNDRDDVARQNEPFPALDEQGGHSTFGDDALTGGTTATAPLSQTTEHREPSGREFPLVNSQEQSTTSKPTNFSYPTGSKENNSQPRVAPLSEDKPVPKEAAENGAAGAGGVAAYEALQHDDRKTSTAHPSDFDDPLASRAHPKALDGYDDQRAAPSHDSHVTGHEASHPVEDQDDHSRRDAALVGAGAVGGGAAAGVLASQHHADDRLEKERARTAEKKHEEALKSEEKRRKEEQKHRKSEEKHRKSEEKHRKSEEKHRRKSDEDKEHKHGLLHRILHRKSKDEVGKEDEPGQSTDKSRASYEQPAAPVTAEKEAFQAGEPYERQAALPAEDSSPINSSSGTPEHSKHSGRNRLHKDPPPSWYEKHGQE